MAYGLLFSSEFSSSFCLLSKSLSHVKLPQIRLSDLPYNSAKHSLLQAPVTQRLNLQLTKY